MTNIREIYLQINSVRSIKKVAKVMEMISLSKMKKTQQRMLSSRPYTEIMRKVIAHVVLGKLEYKHPYLVERKVFSIVYLVISSDRGLTGSLNINIFKRVLSDIKRWRDEQLEVNLVLIGSKASSFFSFMKDKIISQVNGMGDHPSLSELIGPIKSIIQLYDAGDVDKVYIIFNEFKNVLLQIPRVLQILPLVSFEGKTTLKNKFWDYIYEPDPKMLLDILLQRYIELQVYQGVVENLASEQAARMVAMRAASENAGKIIKDLKLVYNKARQTKITQELIEIISGASCVL